LFVLFLIAVPHVLETIPKPEIARQNSAEVRY